MWVRLTWSRHRSALFAQWDNNYGFTPSPLPCFANWAHWGKLGCGVSGCMVSSKWRDDTRCLFPSLDGTAGEGFSWSSLPLTSYVALGTIRGPANLPPCAATATLPNCFTSHRGTEASSPNIAAMNSACLLGVERCKSFYVNQDTQTNWQDNTSVGESSVGSSKCQIKNEA